MPGHLKLRMIEFPRQPFARAAAFATAEDRTWQRSAAIDVRAMGSVLTADHIGGTRSCSGGLCGADPADEAVEAAGVPSGNGGGQRESRDGAAHVRLDMGSA
jgi:hypothetical protein